MAPRTDHGAVRLRGGVHARSGSVLDARAGRGTDRPAGGRDPGGPTQRQAQGTQGRGGGMGRARRRRGIAARHLGVPGGRHVGHRIPDPRQRLLGHPVAVRGAPGAGLSAAVRPDR
ncbi:hypothetical protein RHCRD62_20521 [Rhodococcus sp. RD6.2]|nr:hypothetical protein RHCRD62_20521 [Rhodococcus sp. RD6.2]